jgi:hypothetical protein
MIPPVKPTNQTFVADDRTKISVIKCFSVAGSNGESRTVFIRALDTADALDVCIRCIVEELSGGELA